MSLYEEEARYVETLRSLRDVIYGFVKRIMEFSNSNDRQNCCMTKPDANVFDCSLYRAVSQINELISECVFYIDRFRVHMIHKYREDSEQLFVHHTRIVEIMSEYLEVFEGIINNGNTVCMQRLMETPEGQKIKHYGNVKQNILKEHRQNIDHMLDEHPKIDVITFYDSFFKSLFFPNEDNPQ
jgi:hypothetical protein